MLADISELASGAEVRTRVCIVGAGAAGITLARRLAASKIDVVLLESGGLSLEPSIQALYHGATGAVRYFPLEGVRLRYLGGTTNHWEGQSVPLDATDFDARSWVPDSGWPIAYEEYLRHLADARAICEIPAGSFNYEEVARARGIPPFPNLRDLEPVLLRFSPPTRFGERYRAELRENGNVRCYLHATCLGFSMDASGDSRRLGKRRFARRPARPCVRRSLCARCRWHRKQSTAALVPQALGDRFGKRVRHGRAILHGTP